MSHEIRDKQDKQRIEKVYDIKKKIVRCLKCTKPIERTVQHRC